MMIALFHLVERLMRVQLNEDDDRFVWGLTSTGVFTVKSLYAELINGHTAYLLFLVLLRGKFWRLIHFTFNVKPTTSIANLFGSWLNGIDRKSKELISIGVVATLWAIWNCRNDIIFNKTSCSHYLQVINKATYWIHMWSYLLPAERRGLMDSGCTRMMMVVRAIFCRGGWLHHKRIDG